MEGFEVVERFDPTAVEEPAAQNNEAEILAKLKEKIEKRKLEVDEIEPAESTKKKKNKKQKGQPKPEPVVQEENAADVAEGESVSKKKKIIDTGYQTLGKKIQKKKQKVKRDLPHWLLNPDIAEMDYLANQLPVKDMKGLDNALTDRLEKLGFKNYFPVQRQIIPYLLEPHPYRPHDVCVSAPTGSGKTLAFVLPIIQALSSRLVPKVRAIVVLPTVDLAQQVYKVFSTFVDRKGLRVKLLSGQNSLAKEQSELYRLADTGILQQLADILVVTPGRLVRHIRISKELDLSALRFLVIDEADRMINEITDDWLSILESAVFSKGRPKPGPLTLNNIRKRELPLQKLLFSATLGKDPEKLEQINLFEPKLFRCIVPPKDLTGKIVDYGPEDVGEYSIPAELKQYTCDTELAHKPLMVKRIIDTLELDTVLIFTKSKEATHRLALVLTNLGYSCGELTKDSKEKRGKILNKLKSGDVKILVCSDALARGIDIENLDAVISYDRPEFINTYIHRVGRTARAGRGGTAVTFLHSGQAPSFNKMIKEAGLHNVESLEIDIGSPELMKSYNLALEKTKQSLIQDHQRSSDQKRPFSNQPQDKINDSLNAQEEE